MIQLIQIIQLIKKEHTGYILSIFAIANVSFPTVDMHLLRESRQLVTDLLYVEATATTTTATNHDHDGHRVDNDGHNKDGHKPRRPQNMTMTATAMTRDVNAR